MPHPIPETLRLLGRFWLEEVQPEDVTLLAALPELAQTLPATDPASLTDLAVEYQRLFGFNLPPYESVFVDPSAMLMAPATRRVQALYEQANWTPPAGVRTGAPDHLGLEILALADWLSQGRPESARQLHTRHLALWAPALVLILRRLGPHPFYAALGELTLDTLLAALPAGPVPAGLDPFPTLPPPPIYTDRGVPSPPEPEGKQKEVGLRDIVARLLTPCRAGLFLTREDIGQISRALDLPPVMGERRRMLETLFRLAGQYDLVPALFDRLGQLLQEADSGYKQWQAGYPLWTPYARAWRHRLASTQTVLAELRTIVASQSE